MSLYSGDDSDEELDDDPAASHGAPPRDPYSLGALKEHLAEDAAASILDKDPVAFLSMIGDTGVTEAKVIKMPDVIEASAAHLIKLIRCPLPKSHGGVPVAGKKGKDWFLHVTMASEAARADIPEMVYQSMTSMVKYDMVGLPVVVVLRPSANGSELSGYLDTGSVKTWYEVVRFWDLTPDEVLSGPPVIYPFVALTNVTAEDLPQYIARMQDLMAALPSHEQCELWMRMRVLTGLLYSVEETNDYLKGMCSMPDLSDSSTYREILDIGRLEGKAELVMKMLNSRFKSLPEEITERVDKLTSDQLDDLATSFVFIKDLPDFERWLTSREDPARMDPSKWPR
jgi:hypothetical protein